MAGENHSSQRIPTTRHGQASGEVGPLLKEEEQIHRAWHWASWAGSANAVKNWVWGKKSGHLISSPQVVAPIFACDFYGGLISLPP